MKKVLSLMVTAILILFPCTMRAQTTLVSDNFESLINGGARDANGKYSTGSTASTWWYLTATGPIATVTNTYTGSAPVGNFSGNWLQTNYNYSSSSVTGGTANGTYNWAVSPFAATTLATVGSSLTVQFDFRYYTSTSGGWDRSPQFGFFKSSGGQISGDSTTALSLVSGGYGVNTSYTTSGTITSTAMLFESAGWFASGETTLASINSTANPALLPVSEFALPYTENYKLVLTVVATGMQLQLYLDDVLTLTTIDTTVSNTTFDEFAIRARATGQIDNFSIVTAVPEPETYALMIMAFGVLMISVRRRTLRVGF